MSAVPTPRIDLHPDTGQKIYEPDGQILYDYICDRAHVSVIRGPIGSGTSTASVMKIWQLACEQQPWSSDNVRRSKWAIVRSTYPELIGTTMKTFSYWFPENVYGRINRSRPMHQILKVGDVELEVWFLALDGEPDVEKLRSSEYTGIFFNELEFQDYEIFKEARSRTGRYPPLAEGGPTWYGVIGDLNAPDEDNWLVQMTGEAPYPDDLPESKRMRWPAEWSYFTQPGGLIEIMGSDGKEVIGYRTNPEAENLKWLVPGYYEDLARGADRQWIDSRIMNRITFVADGDPVWPMFKQELHVAKTELQPVANHEVVVSLDFGRRPTALFAQQIGSRIMCQFELRDYGVGATTFAPQVKRFLEQTYPGFNVRFTGDPKGQDKGQADDRTAYDVFAAHGMKIQPAPVKNNHIETRIEVVAHVMQQMPMGVPQLLVSPRCTTLKAACSGRYQLKNDTPLKDKFSDIADCLQYLCLFLGEGRRMIGLEVMGSGAGRMQVHNGRKSMRRVK